MPSFATAAWIAALHDAASRDEGLRQASRGRHLVLQQRVSDGPDGPVSWHIVLDDGTVAVRPGEAEHHDVAFSTDLVTATAIYTGQLSAQVAFMSGRLRLGGDPLVLLEHHEAFGRLGDAFAAIRATQA